jgi:hypothetical protein
MMDFPTSPTNGQQVNGYTWSAASQCWLGGPAGSSGGGGSAIIVSDTPPAGPVDNQQWWESDTGITWLYYNDGNTKQWVAMTDAGGAYLPLTGGTLSGDLTISKADHTQLYLNKPAGFYNQIIGQQAGKARWTMSIGTGIAESGSNAGSDFALAAHDDAGTVLSNPILINRATGVVSAIGLPPTPTATAAAIGQWAALGSGVGVAQTLPAGGTWAWTSIAYNLASGAITQGMLCGVNAGGTTVNAGVAGVNQVGLCWRIA